MSKINITKEQVSELMKIKGDTRGAVLKIFCSYALEKKGEAGIKAVEQRLKELGLVLNLKEVGAFDWRPISQVFLVSFVMFEVFGWEESVAFDMGYDAPMRSIWTKSLVQNLFTPEAAFKNTSKFWRRFCNIGGSKFIDYKPDKKSVIWRLSLEGFSMASNQGNLKNSYNIVLDLLIGFITRFFELITKSKNVKVKTVKEIFENDKYTDFKITW